jgi:hypothetical protein
LWITDHLTFVSYRHVYDIFLGICVRIHLHSSKSELSSIFYSTYSLIYTYFDFFSADILSLLYDSVPSPAWPGHYLSPPQDNPSLSHCPTLFIWRLLNHEINIYGFKFLIAQGTVQLKWVTVGLWNFLHGPWLLRQSLPNINSRSAEDLNGDGSRHLLKNKLKMKHETRARRKDIG